MDDSPLGSSVHGILQARILEWAARPSSRRSSRTRDRTWAFCISCTAGGFFITEPSGKPEILFYWLVCSRWSSLNALSRPPSPHSSSPGVTRTSDSYKFNAQNRICPQDSAPFWGLRHKFSGTPLSALPFSLGPGSSSPHCLIGSLIAQTYSIYFLQLFWLFLVRVLVSNKPVYHC